VQTSWTGEQFELPAGDEPRVKVPAWVTEDTARELMAMAGQDLDELREAAYNRDFEPVPLGITTSIGMDVELNRVQSANVLGLIPGSKLSFTQLITITSASARPMRQAIQFTTAPTTMHQVLLLSWASQKRLRRFPKHHDGPC